ncbi:hypothetical protein TYRP_011434, partial [Tyrophagus putrescentiae]
SRPSDKPSAVLRQCCPLLHCERLNRPAALPLNTSQTSEIVVLLLLGSDNICCLLSLALIRCTVSSPVAEPDFDIEGEGRKGHETFAKRFHLPAAATAATALLPRQAEDRPTDQREERTGQPASEKREPCQSLFVLPSDWKAHNLPKTTTTTTKPSGHHLAHLPSIPSDSAIAAISDPPPTATIITGNRVSLSPTCQSTCLSLLWLHHTSSNSCVGSYFAFAESDHHQTKPKQTAIVDLIVDQSRETVLSPPEFHHYQLLLSPAIGTHPTMDDDIRELFEAFSPTPGNQVSRPAVETAAVSSPHFACPEPFPEPFPNSFGTRNASAGSSNSAAAAAQAATEAPKVQGGGGEGGGSCSDDTDSSGDGIERATSLLSRAVGLLEKIVAKNKDKSNNSGGSTSGAQAPATAAAAAAAQDSGNSGQSFSITITTTTTTTNNNKNNTDSAASNSGGNKADGMEKAKEKSAASVAGPAAGAGTTGSTASPRGKAASSAFASPAAKVPPLSNLRKALLDSYNYTSKQLLPGALESGLSDGYSEFYNPRYYGPPEWANPRPRPVLKVAVSEAAARVAAAAGHPVSSSRGALRTETYEDTAAGPFVNSSRGASRTGVYWGTAAGAAAGRSPVNSSRGASCSKVYEAIVDAVAAASAGAAAAKKSTGSQARTTEPMLPLRFEDEMRSPLDIFDWSDPLAKFFAKPSKPPSSSSTAAATAATSHSGSSGSGQSGKQGSFFRPGYYGRSYNYNDYDSLFQKPPYYQPPYFQQPARNNSFYYGSSYYGDRQALNSYYSDIYSGRAGRSGGAAFGAPPGPSTSTTTITPVRDGDGGGSGDAYRIGGGILKPPRKPSSSTAATVDGGSGGGRRAYDWTSDAYNYNYNYNGGGKRQLSTWESMKAVEDAYKKKRLADFNAKRYRDQLSSYDKRRAAASRHRCVVAD